MGHEVLQLTSQPLPDFSLCFDQANKSFASAAKIWLETRKAVLPCDDHSFAFLCQSLTERILSFSNNILTDHFFLLSQPLAKAAAVVLWTQGKEPKAQERKIETIKKAWTFAGCFNLPPEKIFSFCQEDKIPLFRDIIALAESQVDKIHRLTGKHDKASIVVVEDKLSNMIRVIRDYIELSGNKSTSNVSHLENDEEIDRMTEGEFQAFLSEWQTIILRNPIHFSRFQFVYVLPDKEEDPIGHKSAFVSPLRKERIRRFLEASNQIYKSHAKEKANRFHYFDNQNFDFGRIVTSESVVVMDVDGPLVSQRKVLNDCERRLAENFLAELDTFYRQRFGMDFARFSRFLLDDRISTLQRYKGNDTSSPVSFINKFPITPCASKINVITNYEASYIKTDYPYDLDAFREVHQRINYLFQKPEKVWTDLSSSPQWRVETYPLKKEKGRYIVVFYDYSHRWAHEFIFEQSAYNQLTKEMDQGEYSFINHVKKSLVDKSN